MTGLIISSPLKGWCAPLDEVPDAVFSARMLGDGLAVDPTCETLHAPCDGTIVTIAEQKHALSLRAANGAEILLHVGIDTVALGGKGFKVHVVPGQRVTAGAILINFNLDVLARRAKSMMTPVIVTDGSRFNLVRRAQDRAVEVGEFLFELQRLDSGAVPTETSFGEEVTRTVIVSLEHGIHARPAALLAGSIKPFAASATLEAHGRTANARSPVALMSLGVRKGDTVTLLARGADASAVVSALEAAIGAASTHAKAASRRSKDLAPSRAVQREGEINGAIACRGLGAGHAVLLKRPEIAVEEHGIGASDERLRLDLAMEKVKCRMRTLASTAGFAQREIVGAHLAFLEDPELLAAAHGWVDRGKSAGYGWRAALCTNIDALRASGDPRVAERVDDLLDLETQVLMAMSDSAIGMPGIELPERAILLADDLLPSQLVSLDAARLAGICVATGGPTSHVAILSAALDIPTLVSMGPEILKIRSGTALVIDADEGVLRIAPDSSMWTTAERNTEERRIRRSAERASAQRECRTADGVRIEMLANVGSSSEARNAREGGAEGCGLLRTEFLFLDRKSAPGVEEQLAQYREISDAFADRPLAIRTLDIGGDKPVAYIDLPREENPALGLRGIRVSLQQQDLLRQQLTAILRLDTKARCRILLPMITDASEIRAVRKLVEQIRRDLGREDSLPIGAMIETPAAALCVRQIAREADFFSIGTNDLTQYTLAIDRGHPQLAVRFNARHPAVLRLIAAVVEAARLHERPVAVCGGLASDPMAVPILIGLGIRELSAVPAAIPQLKALIGTLRMQDCEALAAAALEG